MHTIFIYYKFPKARDIPLAKVCEKHEDVPLAKKL